MFFVNGKNTKENRSRINLARPAFSRLQSCLSSQRKKGSVYQAVVQSIPLNGCETWLVRAPDHNMLVAFDNDNIRRMLHMRHRPCVQMVELQHLLCLTRLPAKLIPKQNPIALVVLQDIPVASWPGAPICPHRLRCGAGELETSWSCRQRWSM